MFTPEYSITSEILKNISTIEYCRALIENTPILPHWQRQLQKDARVKFIRAALLLEDQNLPEEVIKKEVDGFEKGAKKIPEIANLNSALSKISQTENELDEAEFKSLQKTLSNETGYRRTSQKSGTNPEEILAETVALFDWYNSLDARDEHSVIVAGVIYARLEAIKPFNLHNTTAALITAKVCLKTDGYSLADFLVFEDFFSENQKSYEAALESAKDGDFTQWIEYYTDAISRKISNLKEKVLLLARDTKVAKATGRIDLTERQQKIVEYLQDYGILQNKDFARVFSNVSEDSVLRDLKVLIDKGIVAKRGSTKSSRYELK